MLVTQILKPMYILFRCFSAYCSQTLAQYLLDRELFHKFWPAVETKMGEEMKDEVNPVILVEALNRVFRVFVRKYHSDLHKAGQLCKHTPGIYHGRFMGDYLRASLETSWASISGRSTLQT
ncbi:unnamed protein product [Clavelina lepadiformis]|uniref:Cullin N-terminal domain-containing protein n=1 Tax=Clavelina lepadiformis TaxID=159417 RepID=A0ABP0G8T1_CLALP